MTINLYVQPVAQFLDDNGDPLSGGLLYTYEPGTTDPKAAYSDKEGNTAHTNPIELNSRGEATIYLDGEYKFVLKRSDETTVWTRDNIKGTQQVPISDNNSIVSDVDDSTKQLRIDVGAITTGTTRVLTMPDANISLPAAGVQPLDATLTALAGVTAAADKLIYATGSDTFSTTDLTAYGRSVLAVATEAAFKALVNLEIGTDVQAYDADLTAIAALAKTDGNVIVGDGTSWVAESGATARTSLGVAIGTDVQAHDAGLDDIAALTPTDSSIIVGDGTNWVAESGATARTSFGLGAGDSPTFTTIDLTGVTDGRVPYIGASGAANSPLRSNGSQLGINVDATAGQTLLITAGSGERPINCSNSSSQAMFYGLDTATTSGESGANAVFYFTKATSTDRSINAAGTINASGADYAEYMRLAPHLQGAGLTAKGALLGPDATGELTDQFSDVVGRVFIKSTSPNLVGGDAWGSEENICAVYGVEPIGMMPSFVPTPYSGPTKEQDGFDEATAAYNEQVEAERAAYEFGPLAAYKAREAAFEDALEQERVKWDRMAHCGRVPANIDGLTHADAGKYLVPVAAADGTITAQAVAKADLTLAQYIDSIGIVESIQTDGRPFVLVKVG